VHTAENVIFMFTEEGASQTHQNSSHNFLSRQLVASSTASCSEAQRKTTCLFGC